MQRPRFTLPALAGSACLAIAAGSLAAGPGSTNQQSNPSNVHSYIRLASSSSPAGVTEHDGRMARLYGTELAQGNSPEATAEQFITANADVFGGDAADFVPEITLLRPSHLQPVMYDAATGSYKFTAVYFTQERDGLPVFGSRLVILVRNEANFPAVLANPYNVRRLGDFQLKPNQNLQMNGEVEAAALQHVAALSAIAGQPQVVAQRQVIWAGVDGADAPPRAAIEMVIHNDIDEWLVIADPATGNILYEEQLICFGAVSGTVEGLSSNGPGADICEQEIVKPLPYLRVTSDGTEAFTDVNGFFTLGVFGGGPHTIDATLDGMWFDVMTFQGTALMESDVVSPPDEASFLFNAANDNELVRAQVNGYAESNLIRDFVLVYNPSYPTLQNNNFPVTVNRTDGFCPGNAWYSPGEESINFCSSSSNYPNTAWSSVTYHEYGHHLVNAGGSGQGAYGEGMGDVMSTLILDDPRLGLGFFLDCGESLRNADNNCQYQTTGCSSCGSQIHACGQLISGCVWDVRNELVSSNPDDYIDIISALAINSILIHSGSSITPGITIDYLTLDDNDGNIFNGTPHYTQINAGFTAHNMAGPTLPDIAFSYPNGRPTTTDPGTTTTFLVDVLPLIGTPVPGTAELHYSVDGGPTVTVSMPEVEPDRYEATLPAADCFSTINWHVSAQASGSGEVTDPIDAPSTQYGVVVATGESMPFADDFETDQGWTVTNQGGLSDGAWERGIPAGGGDRGDPPADADGSARCYVTDNADGNSDVDDGTTILTSPTMDASGEVVILSYYRWYSNTEGDNPQSDTFIVRISDDNGATWSILETVGPSGPEVDGGWFLKEFALNEIGGFVLNDQFRVRFEASDLGGGSIIEAGVDGVVLTQLACEPGVDCVGDIDGDGEVGFDDFTNLLANWGDCPGCPADLDGDDDVDFDDFTLLLAAWGPCV